MILSGYSYKEFCIKKGAFADAPFLKLQRSNCTLIREHERNWKYFSALRPKTVRCRQCITTKRTFAPSDRICQEKLFPERMLADGKKCQTQDCGLDFPCMGNEKRRYPRLGTQPWL